MEGIDVLGSPTISLKNKTEYDTYLNENKDFKINVIPNYTGENTVFPPRAGVVGIIASNYTAWKNFLKTDKDILILFEDDVKISKNIKHFLNKYIDELPEDWDIFSFYIPEDVKYFYNPTEMNLENKSFICKSYTNHCIAAYMISRSGAEKAIRDIETNGISAPADWYILNVKHLKNEPDIFNVYCLKPNTYLPVKEIPEEYYSTSTHYGHTEEFTLEKLLKQGDENVTI